ncbi:MAG: sigma-54 dependent transcriptional regulator [Myxococcota bacterium]
MRGRVLVVDDHVPSAVELAEGLADVGYTTEVAHDGATALAIVRDRPVDAVVTDLRMEGLDGIELLEALHAADPALPVLLVTAHATVDRAVQATRAGAFCFLTKPVRLAEVAVHLRNALRLRELLDARAEPADPDPIVGRSPALLRALATADRVARTDSTVLLIGETGTGKELFAKRIHRRSTRAERPLVAANMGAIPEALVESELFGHVRGAFTGAVADRVGLFEAAHTGTLFLDEVGELSAAAQTRLLRALEERVVRRVGETRDRRVDVRIVAATHRDLADTEQFRRDLYYRLAVVTIELPPLRARLEDVPLLFGHALRRACGRVGRDVPRVDADVLARLCAHRWPGNVRELANAAERVAVLAGQAVTPHDLPGTIGDAIPAADAAPGFPEGDFDLTAWLEAAEAAALRRALQRCDGVKARAAASLGLDRNTFRYKLAKYGIGP